MSSTRGYSRFINKPNYMEQIILVIKGGMVREAEKDEFKKAN